MAHEVLNGYGDKSLGEWIENRPLAFHLRRRLADEEQKRVGEAIDCRTTEEGRKRLKEIAAYLPFPALAMAHEELESA